VRLDEPTKAGTTNADTAPQVEANLRSLMHSSRIGSLHDDNLVRDSAGLQYPPLFDKIAGPNDG
jgi:hypothetical protein